MTNVAPLAKRIETRVNEKLAEQLWSVSQVQDIVCAMVPAGWTWEIIWTYDEPAKVLLVQYNAREACI